MDDDFFGLKKRQRLEAPATAGVAFTFEERAELFDDLLEDDSSAFPLLDAPHEVLAIVGSFLDFVHLAALSELSTAAHIGLEDAFADSWTALLLRDHMPRSRAKRYRAYGSGGSDVTRKAAERFGGVVLTAVDMSRVEWDGMLISSPSCLRYRFLQTMGVLKQRWGRLAQSWEWFVTRIMHRLTYDQLERFVPGYTRPEHWQGDKDAFDEVSHRASMDKDLRARHKECNPKDVIASMKRSLGIADGANVEQEEPASKTAASETGQDDAETAVGQDVLAAMAPTARDQRLREMDLERAAGNADGSTAGVEISEMPSAEAIERMSFSAQMELALRVSQRSGDDALAETQPPAQPAPETTSTIKKTSSLEELGSNSNTADANGDDASVLLRLKPPSTMTRTDEIDVVLREHCVAEFLEVPEHLRNSLEQMALKLTRGDWLLFYESVALEAQLRARAVAHHCKVKLSRAFEQSSGVRQLFDLEAEMLHLPVFRRSNAGQEHEPIRHGGTANAIGLDNLRFFLQAWQEHETWVASLEEYLGPLDLEVERERSNNVSNGAHTPYAADLCRLAFRNFAICEGQVFFVVALAIYEAIARACADSNLTETRELLESLYGIAKVYKVQDDSLALQRSTLREYQYYLLEPLKRACAQFGAAVDEEEENTARDAMR